MSGTVRGDGAHRGFDVDYLSPAEGRLQLGWEGPLLVDGVEVPVGGHPRFDNPFTSLAPGDEMVTITDDIDRFTLDLRAGARTWHPAASDVPDE